VSSTPLHRVTFRHNSRALVIITRWAIVLGVLGAVELLCRSGEIDPFVLPPPTEIAGEVWRTLGTQEFRDDLVRTLVEVTAACAIGITVGFALGTAMWRNRTAGAVLQPYLFALYAMPTLVFYPILIAVLGLGSAPIVTLASVLVLVPVALNTMIGFRTVNPVLERLARSVNATPMQQYRKVMLPAALPVVMAGLQLGVTYGLLATVSTEFILADAGLGFRIGDSYRQFEVLQMWAGIVIVVLLGLVIAAGLSAISRRVRRDMA
jgi:NitT/TauT family transport system permease protein